MLIINWHFFYCEYDIIMLNKSWIDKLKFYLYGGWFMSLVIRKIEKEDYNEVETLTREAFWNIYRPGCSEHFVVHNIHEDEASNGSW